MAASSMRSAVDEVNRILGTLPGATVAEKTAEALRLVSLPKDDLEAPDRRRRAELKAFTFGIRYAMHRGLL